MSQYIQLLGTDTPNSYGGCSYYGLIDNPCFSQTDGSDASCLAQRLVPPRDGDQHQNHQNHQQQQGALGAGSSGGEGYLFFNCPEGTQRFSSEGNIRLTKVKGFFFTRFGGSSTAPHNSHNSADDNTLRHRDSDKDDNARYDALGAGSAVMGLPGLLFTINDAGVRHASFFGPSSCTQLRHSQTALVTGEIQHEPHTSRASHHGNSNSNNANKKHSCRVEHCSGLERFLLAVRRCYFTYRPMSFKLMSPVFKAPMQLPGTTSHSDLSVGSLGGNPFAFGSGNDFMHPLLPTTLTQATSQSSPFIVAVIPLSAHSALVAFRVSGSMTCDNNSASNTMPLLLDSSDLVLGYAVINSPPPAFDAQRAKSLGVKPGPKYGQLKQGVAVYADISAGTTGGGSSGSHEGKCKRLRGAEGGGATTEGDATVTGGRLVQPHEVTRDTIASKCMYVSLILDGNTPADVRGAMLTLLGEADDGALEAALREHCPHLLVCTTGRSDNEEEEAKEDKRRVVIRHVTHVQPPSYFAAATESLRCDRASIYQRYSEYIFSGVRDAVLRSAHAMLSFELEALVDPPSSALLGGTTAVDIVVTRHLFTSHIQSTFSAFPTALAHRHHLHAIKAECFPTGASTAEGSKVDSSSYWPYAFKYRCIPHDGLRWCTEDEKAKGGSKQKPNKAGAGVDPTALVADGPATHVRYPNARMSMNLLSEAFQQAIRDTHSKGLSHNTDSNSDEGGGAVCFLGTGSAVPSKYRNVSGTVLELHLPAVCFGAAATDGDTPTTRRRGVFVLDYGEGSSGQLFQLLQGSSHAESCDRFDEYLMDLKLIFISHGHADHHFGLLSLLSLRHESLQRRKRGSSSSSSYEKLLVVLPAEVYDFMSMAWLHTRPYSEWIFNECLFELIPRGAGYVEHVAGTAHSQQQQRCCPRLHDSSYAGEIPRLPHLEALCNKWNASISRGGSIADNSAAAVWWGAEVFKVDHPANAHALLLRFPYAAHATATSSCSLRSHVFLFSGDTRPSPYLVERTNTFCAAGEGPLICLHEATFGPGFEEEAIKKKHSTLPEALEIGQQTHSQFVVLNHFSQRYPKLPGLAAEHLSGSTVDLLCKRKRKTNSNNDNNNNDDDEATTTADATDKVDDTDDVATTSHDPQPPMCFAFDVMRLSFTNVLDGSVAALLPMLVRLLEEYEQWGEGTTQRLRQ